MTKPNTIKAQLLEYYMAHNHTEFTNTVIKVLSCTDPEIETSLEAHEELNVIVAVPRQQKKSCKCWICQQVGHMSYECPNKGSNKDQAKVFEEIIEAYNLAPVEEAFSDVSSDEDLYYLETSSSESEYDSSTDTDSTDQE